MGESKRTLSIVAIDQAAAAALVSACAPQALDQALARGVASILVSIILRGVVGGRDAKGLDMATGEADGQEGLSGVDGLGEQVRRQREGA